MLADNLEGLQYRKTILNSASQQYGLDLNYSGTMINEWDHSQEIKCDIENVRAVFLEMTALFKSSAIKMVKKIRLIRCYIFAALLYGAEVSTLRRCYRKTIIRNFNRCEFIQRIIQSEVLSKKGPDARYIFSLRNLRKWFSLSCYHRSLQGAVDTIIITSMIDNKRT